MSIVSGPQLAEGLTSMASLSGVIDRFSTPRFIIPDLNVAVYVCDYLLEADTRKLIISFASLFRHATLSSRLQLVSLRHRILSTASLDHCSIINNVSYHNSGYHHFANRAPIDHLRLVLSDELPFTKSS